MAVKNPQTTQIDVDALFRLPLAEFTGARNTLAARLKKSGRGDEADLVKALGKPSISAWAVNQLYWNHREAFDRLLESGGRFHKAQSSRLAGKLADMRTALDARREALTQLSELATSLLRGAGHNPTPDTIHRITTTLEALSAYASRSDAPRPGRLTHDVDPPGFEAFASFIPGAGMTEPKKEPARLKTSRKSSIAVTNTRRKVASDTDLHQLQAIRKAGIAAAKVSLQEARKELIDARARAQSLQAAQKKADAEAKETEKQSRAAEERWEKARATSEEAAERVRSVAVEAKEAAKSLEEAKRTVDKATKELEKLFRGST
ncbi:MAG: hypothetical protein ND895_02370 [Pyrinomonadaceae bacterium]|nr:hypothetical protein [Pyrinomonadaceae bacterium]